MAGLDELGLNKRLYRSNSDPKAYLDSANQVGQGLKEVDFSVGLGPDDTVSEEPIDPNATTDGSQNAIIELLGAYYYRKTTFNNTQIGFRLGVEDNEAKFWFGNQESYINLDATVGSLSRIVGIQYESSLDDNAIIIDPTTNEFAAFDSGAIQTISIQGDTGIELFNSYFTYNGEVQPVCYVGEVLGTAGTFASAPAGWSIVKNGTGDYTITHNLNQDPCYVVCAPRTGHFRYQLVLIDANSFRVTWEETAYGSDTFPVSGGGGGSVTVDGVRIAPLEIPVDVSFQFILMKPVV